MKWTERLQLIDDLKNCTGAFVVIVQKDGNSTDYKTGWFGALSAVDTLLAFHYLAGDLAEQIREAK